MNASESLDLLVTTALAEDVGDGDRTTVWTIPADRRVTARIIAKAPGVVAGTQAALRTFAGLDPSVEVALLRADGDEIGPGDVLLTLEGFARPILTGERVALNFLQHLSGVATVTRQYVDAVVGTAATILDTRKTTPGWRALEKQAVQAGGGGNHRMGLFDMVLIKENHIRAAGGIQEALTAVRNRNEEQLVVEIEVTNQQEAEQALAFGVDRVLFDNMPLETLRICVELAKGAYADTETEASGGVTLATVRAIAETGVDFISVGAITHSVPALDLSLLVDLDAFAP